MLDISSLKMAAKANHEAYELKEHQSEVPQILVIVWLCRIKVLQANTMAFH